VGRDLSDFSSVLDFGCGCGRTLRHFYRRSSSTHFYGVDIDSRAIDWCTSHLAFAQFAVTSPKPPLPFSDGSFDLIYAVSVFTHIDEDLQFEWLNELRRVVKPGGVLLFTVQGAVAQEIACREGHVSPVDLETLQSTGFLFKSGTRGRFKLDGLPDFYQMAFHTRKYVLEVWARFFAIQNYVDQGVNQYQDLVVMLRN
jgi:SAM-dependent methyltransferase